MSKYNCKLHNMILFIPPYKFSYVIFIVVQLGSLDKLDKLLDACQRLGVETTPAIVDGLGVIPLYSWYHEVNCVLQSLQCCIE